MTMRGIAICMEIKGLKKGSNIMGIFDSFKDGIIAYGAYKMIKGRKEKKDKKLDSDRDLWRKEYKDQDDYERDRYLYGD